MQNGPSISLKDTHSLFFTFSPLCHSCIICNFFGLIFSAQEYFPMFSMNVISFIFVSPIYQAVKLLNILFELFLTCSCLIHIQVLLLWLICNISNIYIKHIYISYTYLSINLYTVSTQLYIYLSIHRPIYLPSYLPTQLSIYQIMIRIIIDSLTTLKQIQ